MVKENDNSCQYFLIDLRRFVFIVVFATIEYNHEDLMPFNSGY